LGRSLARKNAEAVRVRLPQGNLLFLAQQLSPAQAEHAGHGVEWAAEWELLGFATGPPLLSLLRATLAPDVADSRALAGREGRRVKVAGLVASCREGEQGSRSLLTLEDEFGMIDVQAAGQLPEERLINR
jgi:hypothetical protein